LKDAVLRILKQSRPKHLSGEEICKILRVTRTAVWKQIQSLRQEGYEIDARPRAGYLLLAAPDKLYPEEIGDNLATRFIGREIYYCESVPSTNDLAKELAQKGVPEGTLVVVEEQTGGRGRLGRVWHSPSGEGLWFSLVFRPPVTPARAFQMTILAAVALAEAIRDRPAGRHQVAQRPLGGREKAVRHPHGNERRDGESQPHGARRRHQCQPG